MVVLAQLAEHRIVVPSVVGSSPTLHPNADNQQITQNDAKKCVANASLFFSIRLTGHPQ